MRPDGRGPDELRSISIEPNYLRFAEGSALIELGHTKVICAASVDDKVPPFLKGQGSGWITAEYSLLPRSTSERTVREAAKGRVGGRTHEIQRLIGRSLRASVDMTQMGERTITVDCDVLQADGGTRTAAITGGFVALYQALRRMKEARVITTLPVRQYLAAVSCGVIDGEPRLDLDYAEDFAAGTDMNCVMTEDGTFVEVQATAERAPYSRAELDSLLDLATKGILELIAHQKRALAGR